MKDHIIFGISKFKLSSQSNYSPVNQIILLHKPCDIAIFSLSCRDTGEMSAVSFLAGDSTLIGDFLPSWKETSKPEYVAN